MKKIKKYFCFVLSVCVLLGSFPIINITIEAMASDRWNVINTYGIDGSDIVAQARKYLGVPYDTSGGNYQYRTGYGDTMMFDCSGFVYRVCRDVGLASSRQTYGETKDANGNYHITADTRYQRYYGTDISHLVEDINKGDYSGLRAGDLLFFTGDNINVSHVAIYSGNGTIVHSEGWEGCVAEHPVNRYPTSNNWYFAACRLIEPYDYLISRQYDCHCIVEVTENDKDIMDRPCSKKTDSNATSVEAVNKGSSYRYEAIGLILNTQGNYWYKVITKSGRIGYIYAGNVECYSHVSNSITGPGITVPDTHTYGKPYPLTGSITTTYNYITSVSAYVYPGTKTSGKEDTGDSATVNGKSYSLNRSSIDTNTVFNGLSVGQHTYVVTASFKYYYATEGKATEGKNPPTKTGSVPVYTKTFKVEDSHSHSFSSHYEADHPHRVYNKCSCGDWYYTGATTSVSSCSQCNPAESSTLVFPDNGGIYKVASGVGNNMYLDFACSSDNVQIYENCDNHSDPNFVISQYYQLTHVGDGWYTIVNIGNGKAADVASANPASGTNIIQYEHHKGDSQLFRFYDAGDGYCYIKSKLGTYVDVSNGDNLNNTNVWAYSFNGSNAQKWMLEQHQHFYSYKITQNATCTSTGVKEWTCIICKHSYRETIAKASHSYTSSVTKQPTCTATGVRTYKCSCGASCTETIAKKGHTWVAATCTVAKTCSTCKVTEDSALGHSYSSTVTKVATCTATGTKTFTCSRCSHSYTESIAATGHTWTSATCTVAKTCTSCNATEGSALGHSYCQFSYKWDFSDFPYTVVEKACDRCWTSVCENYELKYSTDFEIDCGLDYVEIFWDGRFVDQEFYDVDIIDIYQYDEEQGKYNLIQQVADYVTSYKVTGLNPETEYRFCIVAHPGVWSGDNLWISSGADFISEEYLGAITANTTCDHNSTKTIESIAPTCSSIGFTAGRQCSECGEVYVAQTIIPMTDHTDSNADGYCDYCTMQIETLMQFGDVDGDGQITSSDARTALRAAVGLDVLTDAQKKAADVDGDNNLTSTDARLILRAAVGLEDPKSWLK